MSNVPGFEIRPTFIAEEPRATSAEFSNGKIDFATEIYAQVYGFFFQHRQSKRGTQVRGLV